MLDLYGIGKTLQIAYFQMQSQQWHLVCVQLLYCIVFCVCYFSAFFRVSFISTITLLVSYFLIVRSLKMVDDVVCGMLFVLLNVLWPLLNISCILCILVAINQTKVSSFFSMFFPRSVNTMHIQLMTCTIQHTILLHE